MKISKIEVKNITHYARGSEGTPCYNATVYINGKRAVEVSNDGRGGMDRQSVWHEKGFDLEEINAWCVKQFGQKTWEHGGKSYTTDFDLENYCHEQLFDHLDIKLLKRAMKKSVMFFKDKSHIEEGKYSEVKFQNDYGGAVAYVKDNFPSCIILNDMPMEKALQIYRGKDV